MRILHINTATTGGAATAALRIHQGLCNQGYDSHFLTLHNSTKTIVNHHVYNGKYISSQPQYPILSFKNLLKEKFFKVYEKSLIKYKKDKENEIELSVPKKKDGYYTFSVFSSPFTPFDITDLEIYKQSDIIHLHWVAGFLDYESFFSKNKKPIVWTFHDMNPIMGGFHYKIDLLKNLNSHSLEEEKFKEIKLKSYSKASLLSIVSPSKWLFDSVKDSSIFKSEDIYHVRYRIDLDLFKPRCKNLIRSVLSLPDDKLIYLISSLDLSDFRKGTDLVLPVIESLDMQDVIFLLAGSNFKGEIKSNVISLGPINDELLMSFVYNAADYFILSSREDNLPNTMIESIASGTPVIAFDIGDNKEIILENNCGIICDEISSNSLLMSLLLSKKIKFNSSIISKVASEYFNEKLITDLYKNIYIKNLKI